MCSRRALSIALAVALIVSACSDDTDTSTETPSGDEPGTTTTVDGDGSDPDEDQDTDAPSTTEPGSTATTSTTTSTTTTTIDPGPALPDGLPATWFGTYFDPDADLAYSVEVDTATGEIIRTFGDYITGVCEEFNAGGDCAFYLPGAAPVSVDVSDEHVAFGICCEPTVGWTPVFDRGTGVEIASNFGSEPALAPFDNIVASAGYADGGAYILTDIDTGDSATLPLGVDWGDSSDWDGGSLAVEIGNGIAIWQWDGSIGSDGDVTPTVSPADAGRAWASPTWAASGNIVVAEHDVASGNSVGTVLDASGGFTLAVPSLVLATFPYEGRVLQQTYDADGVFLIYALNDGSVRWQGGGSGGVLKPAGSNFTSGAWF